MLQYGWSPAATYQPTWPPSHGYDNSFSFNNVHSVNQSFNVNTNDFKLKQSESLSVLYSNVVCLTQNKKLELECLLSNKHVDIIGLIEIY